MKNVKNLMDCTFIIPVKIEHPDRYRNAHSVLNFLNHHFQTHVMIYEVAETENSKLDFLGALSNLNITHILKHSQPDEIFHRTKYLNIMLDRVETPIVVNYDIDVFLPPSSYLECRNQILAGEADVYYPYVFGKGQYQIIQGTDREGFYQDYSPNTLLIDAAKAYGLQEVPLYYSEYGHCIFFNTEIYRKEGGENEEFISYGPEDKERGFRFKKLGRRVKWLNSVIFHFEHFRGQDSSTQNPFLDHNNKLFEKISSMDPESLRSYYSNLSYRNNYQNL
jgi:hypothetical protein